VLVDLVAVVVVMPHLLLVVEMQPFKVLQVVLLVLVKVLAAVVVLAQLVLYQLR
tara:strand:+ start:285 stop:446 length:162 start_codon:yes stop_codon:yes gene_type:complete